MQHAVFQFVHVTSRINDMESIAATSEEVSASVEEILNSVENQNQNQNIDRILKSFNH